MTDKNLCDSCINYGCEFQSGIVRTECAFYMPPTALTIPEHPTNGDMIKALFMSQHTYIKRSESKNLVVFDNLKFPYDWWNAPYKGAEHE